MPEITYDMSDPPNGIYALIGGLYVDEVSSLNYVWHTQPTANLRKRRLSDRAVVQEISVSSNRTYVDRRTDYDIYHAVGDSIFRRDVKLHQVWKQTPNSGTTVDGVTATGYGPAVPADDDIYQYNEDGSSKWQASTPSGESVADISADDNGNVYATESIGDTVKYFQEDGGFFAEEGGVDWQNSGRFGDAIAVWANSYAYVSVSGTDEVVQLDASDGTENWNIDETFASPSGIGCDGSGNVVVIHANGVAKLSATDGSTLWNNTAVNYDATVTDVSAIKGGNILVFGNDTLAALDPSTGAEQWSETTDASSSLFSMVSYPRPGPFYTESW